MIKNISIEQQGWIDRRRQKKAETYKPLGKGDSLGQMTETGRLVSNMALAVVHGNPEYNKEEFFSYLRQKGFEPTPSWYYRYRFLVKEHQKANNW